MKIGVCEKCREETKLKAIKSFNREGTLQPENVSCTGGYIVEIPYKDTKSDIWFHGEYVDVNYCVKCGKSLLG